MTPNLKKYRELEIKLSHMRLKCSIADKEETLVRDAMDKLWWELSTDEQDILESAGTSQ